MLAIVLSRANEIQRSQTKYSTIIISCTIKTCFIAKLMYASRVTLSVQLYSDGPVI